jgi:hypothetical protein
MGIQKRALVEKDSCVFHSEPVQSPLLVLSEMMSIGSMALILRRRI